MNFILNKNQFLSNFLVFALIILSGNPFFNYIGFEVAHILFFIPLFMYTVYKGYFYKIVKELNFFLVFFVIFLLQVLYFSNLNFFTYAGFFVRALICFCVMLCVPDFCTRFVRVMFFITKMGVLFWLISFSGLFSILIGFVEPLHQDEWTSDAVYALFFHTLYVDEFGETLRNAGLFWEPGAFAGYIILSLIFLIVNERSFSKKEYKVFFAAFSVGILTSMSTMGYLALTIIVLLKAAIYFSRERSKINRFIISMLAMSMAVFALTYMLNSELVGDKISDQLMKAAETSYFEYGENNTRFGSLLFDFYYIEKSPLFGNGLHESTRYAEHPLDTIATGHGNGLTDFIAKFGFIGFLFFIYSWIVFSKNFQISAFYSIILLSVFMVTLFSEPFFNYPLYWFIFFRLRAV